MRRRLAWALFALTCALVAAKVVLLVLSDVVLFSADTFDDGFPLISLGTVAASALGALIVTRHPRHRIGWLFVYGQLGTAIGLAAHAYGLGALTGGYGSFASGQVVFWIGAQFGAVYALTFLAVLFLLAPDGRLLSPRWRWPLGVALLGLVADASAIATVSPRHIDEHGELTVVNPLAVQLEYVAICCLGIGLLAGVLSLGVRLSRAHDVERRQLRWIMLAAAGLAAGIPALVVIDLMGGPPWLTMLTLMTAYFCVPIFTGIAVLRFRLYDIDVIISRGIVLTALTAFVALGYIAVVVLIGELVTVPRWGGLWASLLATIVVALAFQPLRRRVEQFADRVVYGAQAAPYETLASFSASLQDSRDLTDILPRVAEAIGRAVGASSTAIRFDVPGATPVRASWPHGTPGPPALVLPVADGAERLGTVGLTMPPGRGLRSAEERLLGDFTRLLGEAFRHARLEAELSAEVERLAEQTERLAASSRRLLAAREAERQRFEASIARSVLPHLRRLSEDLAGLQAWVAEHHAFPAEAADPRIRDVTTALEALRTLTRGVFPAQLSHRGLVTALRSHLERAGHGDVMTLGVGMEGRRFDPRLESTSYFCIVEVLRCLDRPTLVAVRTDDERLVIEVSGYGIVGAAAIQHLVDRVEALSGGFTTTSAGSVTTVLVEVPLPSSVGGTPDLAQPVRVER